VREQVVDYCLTVAPTWHFGCNQGVLTPPPPPDRGPATLTVPEAGRILGLGRSASYDAVRRGELAVLRFGRRQVVSVVWLQRLLAEGQRPGDRA